jgi:hypothetical protein
VTLFFSTKYWVALLRYVGCTGHAHEVAAVLGDEIAIRAQTLVHDAANPAEVMRDVVAFATAGRPQDERDHIVQMIQQTAQQWAVHNFASGCEVADMLVQRLDFGHDVRNALRFTFERWNGNGYPDRRGQSAIPSRCASCISQPRHGGDRPDLLARQALTPPATGATAPTIPKLADLFVESGRWFDPARRSIRGTPCWLVELEPHRVLADADLDEALTVAADFIDLKSPYMGGHSRRCAQLGTGAARLLGFSQEAVSTLRRAALVHDFGTTGVSNSIWDKRGPLTRRPARPRA